MDIDMIPTMPKLLANNQISTPKVEDDKEMKKEAKKDSPKEKAPA